MKNWKGEDLAPEEQCVLGCEVLGPIPGCTAHNPIVRSLRRALTASQEEVERLTKEKREAFDLAEELQESAKALAEALEPLLGLNWLVTSYQGRIFDKPKILAQLELARTVLRAYRAGEGKG
jgi:hypothetical protein